MDVLSRPVLAADHRIPYGPHSSQFGDLWLPILHGSAPAPVVVFFHGGWWKSKYDLGYAGYLCRALRDAGIACWSVEYRRRGETGGGWPATFQDAAAGIDHLPQLARQFPLDLARVITMGHSAGGHLAFWTAGRQHVPQSSVIWSEPRVPLRGAVALAGAVDLQELIALSGHGQFAHDREEVVGLMGGAPADVPDRYSAGDPGALLPLGCPQVLFQGTLDDQIPPLLPVRWAETARHGARVRVHMLPGADHFDVVDPDSQCWPDILHGLHALLA